MDCCVPCFVTVDASERGIVQTLGKYSHLADPGLQFICYPCQTLNSVTIQVQQEDVKTETKTRDNVIVTINTSVQFAVDATKVQDYYFKLSNPWQQMAAYVENIVRGQIPKLELDAVYSAKTELADEIKKELSINMSPFGVHIHSCLLTDVSPSPSVLAAMNEINTAKRNREANIQMAEAEKTTRIKQAEGQAESLLLQIDAEAKANVRKSEGEAQAAIRRAEGAAASAVRLAQAEAEVQRLTGEAIARMRDESGLDVRQVVHYVVASQYLDALANFGRNGNGSIVLSHGPAAVGDIQSQVRVGLLQAVAGDVSKGARFGASGALPSQAIMGPPGSGAA